MMLKEVHELRSLHPISLDYNSMPAMQAKVWRWESEQTRKEVSILRSWMCGTLLHCIRLGFCV